MDHQEEFTYLQENLSARVGGIVAALTDDQQRWLLAVPDVQSRLSDLRLQQANLIGLEDKRDFVLASMADTPRPDQPYYYHYQRRGPDGRPDPNPGHYAVRVPDVLNGMPTMRAFTYITRDAARRADEEEKQFVRLSAERGATVTQKQIEDQGARTDAAQRRLEQAVTTLLGIPDPTLVQQANARSRGGPPPGGGGSGPSRDLSGGSGSHRVAPRR
ncbi:hypothetical protein [Micromonospora sp. SH-82]|uniref:hypothetical protein n=1 Tax=Micromonospora sp. SH-82 TaxID=3132938 RepID=UPI003EBADA37